MANTKRNRKVHAAGILLSLCALGGIAAAAPRALFAPEAVITASAWTDQSTKVEIEFDTATKQGKVIGYTGTLTSLTLPVDTANHAPSAGWKYVIGNEVFKGNKKLTSVTIPAAYTEIGNYAFQNCSNLTSLTLNEGLTSIGLGAFDEANVNELYLPKSLKIIGAYSFYGNDDLNKIEYLGGAEYGDMKFTTIGNYAFCNCVNLKKVRVMPKTLTSLGAGAFCNCRNIETIDLDYTQITTIQPATFKGALDCGTLWLPRSGKLETIYAGAFEFWGGEADSTTIKCWDASLAYDTANFKIKNKIALKKSNGDPATWSDVLGNNTKFILYPNTALHYALSDATYDLRSFVKMHNYSNVWVQFLKSGNASTTLLNDTKMNALKSNEPDWFHANSALQTGWPKFENLEIPIPGKVFNASQPSIMVDNQNHYYDGLQIDSVKCYDIKTKQELTNGSRYKDNTNYYYKIRVSTKDGYSAYLPYSDYLAENDSVRMERKGIFANATNVYYDAYSNLNTIVSATCTKQVFDIVVVVHLEDAKINSTSNAAPYASKHYVTSTDAGSVSAGHTGNLRTYTLKTLTPLTITPTVNGCTFTDPFDCDDYYDLGGPTQYYGATKSGTTGTPTWTGQYYINNLEPETTYVMHRSATANRVEYMTSAGTFTTKSEVNIKSAGVEFGSSLGVYFNAKITDKPIRTGYAYIGRVSGSTVIQEERFDPAQMEPDADGVYSFGYYIRAKEMYDKLRFRHTGSPTPVLTKGSAREVLDPQYFDYSLMDYLNGRIQKGSAGMKKLAQATKDYGIMCQKFFGYNESAIPAADLTKANSNISAVTKETLEPFAMIADAKPSYIESRSINVAYDEDNALYYMFSFKEGANMNNMKFYVDGVETTPTSDGDGGYYLCVKKIRAKNLDTKHTFVIKNGNSTNTVKASVLSYSYQKLVKSETSTNMKNLAASSYLYWKAADEYFNPAN